MPVNAILGALASKPTQSAQVIAGLGAALMLAAMLHEGSPRDLSWWAAMPVFGAWVLLPPVLVFALSRRWASAPAAQTLLVVAGVVVTVAAARFLYEALFAPKNSTFGLAFLFVPALQLALVAPLALAAWWTARKGERP